MVASGPASTAGNAQRPIDPFALAALYESLTGHKVDRRSMTALTDEYDDLADVRADNEDDNDDEEDRRRRVGNSPNPDDAPKDVNVGAINPYALVEAMIGRKLDRRSMNASRIMSDALQTDYDEMFDMRYRSVLYAGLKLNEQQRTAEFLEEKDVRILRSSDLESPDLSRVVRLEDLEKIGLKDMGQARVKMARMQNGKLRLVVNARSLARTASNRDVTLTINDLCLPYRRHEGEDGKNRRWQPPNAEWRDLFEVLVVNGTGRRLIDRVEMTRLGSNCIYDRKFDDPCQGAASNSWFVAALFSVFWSDPAAINRATRLDRRPARNDEKEHERTLKIRFHDKGGRNNAETATIEVDYEVPINCTSNEPIYCRSSDGIEIWPALYEKAYARWIEGGQNKKSKHGRNASEDRPDMTQMHHGDPIKAMAQMNNKEPQYYFCDNHPASDLVAVVRNSCVNFKTINPMCAFTHATGSERAAYRGANLVANHAYSVLGWASEGTRQYIVLRNPWGVTEPRGLSSYGGLIDRVDEDLWPPACLCDHEGVIALDARSFKEHFRCLGVAK